METKEPQPPAQRHGTGYEAAGQFSPDAVAASMQRNDGGFGRAQETYFDHPVLRKAHWQWEIVAYFFVGGASAASAALASIAHLFGDDEDESLVRNGRYVALAGSAISSALLVKDLGRPERFLNMLRIFKLKSPMSVGVYALVTFATTSGFAALEQARADGIIPFDPFAWFPKRLRVAAHAVSAAFMICYTGVLLSATAIPVWYRGRRHIPAIFVLSGSAAGCALQNALIALTGGSGRTSKKLETIELFASLAEAALLWDYERVAGEPGKALFGGARGRKLRTYTVGLGIAVPALLTLPSVLSGKSHAKPKRLRTLVAAACALVGGYVLRECVVYAGRDSADDPRAYLRHPE
ncbi:MAG TPA: NrfD/PsrC family molybdoenzyme membrane anchor subunit [Candidatus Elarobacter sp.]